MARRLSDASIPFVTQAMDTDVLHLLRDIDGTPADKKIRYSDIFSAAVGGSVNVKDAPYMAKGDGVRGMGSMTSGSAVFTADSAIFTDTATDAGKVVDVSSAGAQATLVAIVISRNSSTSIELSTPASFTQSNQTMVIRGRTLTDVSTTAGDATVTSASGAFTDADIFHPLTITLAGRWNKTGTIVSVTSPTVATLSFTASGNVVSKQIMFGTDDTDAINDAKAAMIAAGAKRLVFPAGFYVCGTFAENVTIAADADNFGAIKLTTEGLTFEGDGKNVSQLWAIGPQAGDASTFGAILLISDGANHTTLRDLGFKGTNAFAQVPTTSAKVCDGVFIGMDNAEDTKMYRCSFDNMWLIAVHAISNGNIEGTVRNIDIDHCTGDYNAFDAFNPSAGRGLRFTNCSGYYNGTGLLECGGGDAFIDANKAYYTRGSGFSVGGFGDSVVGEKNTFTNNTAEYCGAGAIIGCNVQFSTVTGNILMRNYNVGLTIKNDAGFGTLNKRGLCKNNIIVSNGYAGLSSSVGMSMNSVSDWIVEGNYIRDHALAGYVQGLGLSVAGISNVDILDNHITGHAGHDYASDNTSSFRFRDGYGADVSFGSATVTYLKSRVSELIIGGGAAITKHISATDTVNFGSVNNGGMLNYDMAVSGLALGDTVTVGFDQIIPVGAILTVSVLSAGHALITIYNVGAGTFDLGSGTLRVDAWKH